MMHLVVDNYEAWQEGYHLRSLYVVHETDKAIALAPITGADPVWLPKSQVCVVENGIDVDVYVPEWLARQHRSELARMHYRR